MGLFSKFDLRRILDNQNQKIREKIEKFSVEYDDDGNKINTSSHKKAILNKIEKKLTEYRTKINTQQLSLFEL